MSAPPIARRAARSLLRASPRRMLLSAAVLLLAGAGLVGSGANFTATSANPSSVLTTGIVRQSNSMSGSAVLTVPSMAPGDSATGTVDIGNTGDLPAVVSVSLGGLVDTPASANFSSYLKLDVADLGTPGCTTSCASPVQLYSGTLRGAIATSDLGTFAPATSHRYRFTVTYPNGGSGGADNAYGGARSSFDISWGARQGGSAASTLPAGCSTTSAYRTRVLSDSPYEYFRLGESSGTTAADASGSSRDGAYQGSFGFSAPGALTCDPDTAVTFSGSEKAISTPAAQVAPANFTIETWFKTTTPGGRLVGFGNYQTGTSTSYDRLVYLTNTGKLVFGVYPNTVRVIQSPGTYLDGQWHMVAASLSSTAGMRLYVDGTQVAADPSTTTGENTTGYWRVGYDNVYNWTDSPSNWSFNGAMDEAAIFSSALPASAIAAQYAAAGS